MKRVQIKNKKVHWICLADRCPKNGCGAFNLTENLVSFWNIDERLIPITEEDHQVFLKNDLADHLKKEVDEGWYLKTDKAGICPLLKKSMCSIYELRPQCCRGYPFFFNKYNGLCVNETCPGFGKGWTESSKVKEFVECAKRVYRCQMEKTNQMLNRNA